MSKEDWNRRPNKLAPTKWTDKEIMRERVELHAEKTEAEKDAIIDRLIHHPRIG